MKKKLVFLIVLAFLTMAIGCGKEDSPCEHVNVAVDEAVFPTCTQSGLTRGSHCADCGIVLTEQQELSPVAHNYEEKLVSGEDTYYVYICKMCGDETDGRFSVGLSIEPNHEDKTCMITGIGTCTDTEVRIRSTISGYTVTAIDYSAFRNCTKLVSIEIPDSVTRIRDNAFMGCASLKSIVIPDGVTQIESWAFRDCTSLESVTIPDSVTHFGNDVFTGCKSIDNVYFTGDLEAWCKLGFGSISSNPLYKGANLYINNVLLEDAVIPNTVHEIKCYSFGGCESLKSITISDGVVSIGDYAFSSCVNLESVKLGETVDFIGRSAFSDCTSLKSVALPAVMSNVREFAFQNCTNIEDVYFTGNLTDWCEIVFDTYSNPLHNGANLYINGALLEDAEIVLTSKFITFIREYALQGCESLKNLTISDGVTGIEMFAFNSCTNLESVTIPKSMKEIGWYSFEGCTSLETVYFCGSEEEWDKMSILGAGNGLISAARFYYSETQPSEGAGYWHYVDGVPTLW